MSLVYDETLIRTSRPGLTQANSSTYHSYSVFEADGANFSYVLPVGINETGSSCSKEVPIIRPLTKIQFQQYQSSLEFEAAPLSIAPIVVVLIVVLLMLLLLIIVIHCFYHSIG